MTAVDQYLQRHAEPEAALTDGGGLAALGSALVVPARAESPRLLDALQVLWGRDHGELVILVVNRPPGAAPDRRLPDAVAARYAALGPPAPLQWFCPGGDNRLLLVDRCTRGACIAPDQGVGLARKIGCDIACRLIHEGRVGSPWIFSSDADVLWPPDYLRAGQAQGDAAALLLPFRHVSHDPAAALPVQLYELALRYYVLGLALAGSPYAYHSIGSIIAADYRHYAQVRGFPRRAAGEDFYLLNKLAKTGCVRTLDAPELLIRDRASTRVPFGTGPARQRIALLRDPLGEYPFYHPGCFAALAQCLQAMAQLAAERPADAPGRWRELTRSGGPELRSGAAALADLGFERALRHATSHSRSSAAFSRHLRQWFDAFRTLKFVHAMRARKYPSLPLRDLLQLDAFLPPLLPPSPGAPHDAQWLTTCNRALARATAQCSTASTASTGSPGAGGFLSGGVLTHPALNNIKH